MFPRTRLRDAIDSVTNAADLTGDSAATITTDLQATLNLARVALAAVTVLALVLSAAVIVSVVRD